MNLTSAYLPRYTNYTMISGEPTLQPQDMYDKWNNPNKPGKKFMKKNPWNAPGSAPVYGEGCGVNGGNGDHDCNIDGGTIYLRYLIEIRYQLIIPPVTIYNFSR